MPRRRHVDDDEAVVFAGVHQRQHPEQLVNPWWRQVKKIATSLSRRGGAEQRRNLVEGVFQRGSLCSQRRERVELADEQVVRALRDALRLVADGTGRGIEYVAERMGGGGRPQEQAAGGV